MACWSLSLRRRGRSLCPELAEGLSMLDFWYAKRTLPAVRPAGPTARFVGLGTGKKARNYRDNREKS